MSSRKRFLLASLLLLLGATFLRFYNIDAQSFWNDEGNSARLSERSLRLIIEGTASDIHPPLYYFILRGWRVLVGESEFALRSVSAFSGVLLIALVVPYVRLLFGNGYRTRMIAFLSCALLAANPALIYYSQEARMYMLLPFLALLGTALLLRWRVEQTRSLAVGYVLVMVAGLYTHYFFPIVFVGHGLAVLFGVHQKPGFFGKTWFLGRATLSWIGLATVSVALYLPWLPYFLNGLGGNRGVAQPVWEYLNGLGAFLLWGVGASFVQPAVQSSILLWLFGIGLLVVQGALWNRPILLFSIDLPLIALVFLGATDASFYKFALLILPPLIISIVAAGVKLTLPTRARGLQTVLVGAIGLFWIGNMLAISLLAVDAMWTEPALARDDYRGIVAEISAENHPNAAIILNAPNQWEVFTYYHTDGAPVYPLPREQGFEEVSAELDQILQTHDRIYVLYWGDQLQDPNRWVETRLDAATFKAREEWQQDIRFATYAVPPDMDAAEIVSSADWRFGSEIQIKTIQFVPTRPGDIFPVRVESTALTPLQHRYKLFIHILNSDGALVAQRDIEPTPLTTAWTPNETHTQNLGILLPIDLPSGSYTATIGFYDTLHPTRRLPLTLETDTLPFTTIEVSNP